MPKESVWDMTDLGFFLGALLPSSLAAAGATGFLQQGGIHSLAYQGLLYALLLSVLYVLARIRHSVPLGQAVDWTLQFQGAWWIVLGAPILAIVVSVVGVLLRAPLIPSTIDQLTAMDVPLPVVGAFAVILGPLFEEIVFRGFVQPLLVGKSGEMLGVVLTSGLFSLLHGAQNEWLWQYLLLLFLVGLVLGSVKQRTGSTTASFLLHMAYNLTQLTAAIVSRT